jgi:hypothetical protein
VSGHADLLPDKIKTIAIPPFDNLTTRYKLTERLASSLTREFITRTRYQVVHEPGQADALLKGAIMNYFSFPTVFDSATGRASGVQISVILRLSLMERQTGRVLFTRPSMEFKQRYEISVDQSAYFEESDIGLERLSHDVSRSVVSAMLEAF